MHDQHFNLQGQCSSPLPASPSAGSFNVFQNYGTVDGMQNNTLSNHLGLDHPTMYAPTSPNLSSRKSSIDVSDFEALQFNDKTLSHHSSGTSSKCSQEPTKEAVPTKLPNGKFWIPIKKDNQVLYQCPWPNCEKSTFYIIQFLLGHTT
jgi:hypothetical protein